MSTGVPSLTILSDDQKFNGENFLQWKSNMMQLLGSKGLLGYVEGSILKPSPPKPATTTSESSSTYTVQGQGLALLALGSARPY